MDGQTDGADGLTARLSAAGQRSFAYRAAPLLNKLPESVRGREMLSFIRAVNEFFSHNQFFFRPRSLHWFEARIPRIHGNPWNRQLLHSYVIFRFRSTFVAIAQH